MSSRTRNWHFVKRSSVFENDFGWLQIDHVFSLPEFSSITNTKERVIFVFLNFSDVA